jgi:hypothetical protein
MSDPLTSTPPELLQEEFFLTDAARLRRWLPWLHLGSVLRMAFDPRKLVLAMVALLLLSLPTLGRGWAGLGERGPGAACPPPWKNGYLFQDNTFHGCFLVPAPLSVPPGSGGAGDEDTLRMVESFSSRIPTARATLADPWSTIRFAVSQGPQMLTPVTNVLGRGQSLIESKFRWGETSLQVAELLWIWAVWAFFGTLLCRLTALDFMGRDVGWGEAARYCRSRSVSAFASPLLPMIGVAAFWFPCVVAGWVTRIPSVGQPVVAGAWFFLWLCGGILALLLLGLTLCWPLMVATIGVEGTDAFDGLSRSYNYLFSRPWYVIGMTLLVLVMGGCTLFGVRWLAMQADHLAVMSLASGSPDAIWQQFQPRPVGEPVLTETTVSLLSFSRGLITLGIHAFAHSFFWVAVTVMFLLLRKSVDSTPLDYLTVDRQTPLGELPIVGMAAAERREQAAHARSGG